MRCDLFEMEKGMSAVEIAKHLCGKHTSLIGEFVISDGGRQEILREAKPLFERLCMGRFLDNNDKNLLVLACVLVIRNSVAKAESSGDWERAERSKVWPIIFEGLDHWRVLERTGCNEQKARILLSRVMQERIRFFAEGGQAYFNTLRLHALAPDGSIRRLYDILYTFYHRELGCSYDPQGNGAADFVSRMSQRWSREDRSGSDGIAVSQQKLFVLRPNYMTAVCDALLEKIDRIVQGDLEGLSDLNRWDVLLKDWYTRKSAEDKRQMSSDRRYARRSNYSDRRGKITPVFEMEDGKPCLVVPGFRHPGIDQVPVARLYQNGTLCFERTMRIFGEPGAYCTHPMVIPLAEVLQWKRMLKLELRILVGSMEIYRSNGDLLRDYLCFTEDDRETRLVRCDKPLRLITIKREPLNVEGPNDFTHDKSGPYRLTEICTRELKSVTLARVNILEEPAAPRRKITAYMMPEADAAVEAELDGAALPVYSSQPVLHVPLAHREEGKNYRLIINGNDQPLYNARWADGKFLVVLPGTVGSFHSVQLRDLDRGRITFQCCYAALPGLAYRFDRAFYLDEQDEGTLTVTAAGVRLEQPFRLEAETDSVFWKLEGMDFRIPIPKITVRLDEQDALRLPAHMWYKKVRHSTLTISAPDDVSCVVAAGAYIREKDTCRMEDILDKCGQEEEVVLGLIIRWKDQRMLKELTHIRLQEVLFSNPVVQDGRRIRWEFRDEYFVGDDKPQFEIEMGNDQGGPWRLVATRKSCYLQQNYPCKEGSYGYRVWLVNRCTMADGFLESKPLPRLLLGEGKICIENPPEDRFRNHYILLDQVHYDIHHENRAVWAVMKPYSAKIDRIRFVKTMTEDGQQRHLYQGELILREDGSSETVTVYFVPQRDREIVVYTDENLDETVELDLSEKKYNKRRQQTGIKIYTQGKLSPRNWACANCFSYMLRRVAD